MDSKLKRGSEFSDDISAYDLILKNKERLLSFEEPTRFIFSHSALREGWDNPNVFQICTLKHGGDSSTQKRQEVGRGLRLCVNQAGDRMDAETVGDQVHVLNTLTVIASEGYVSFVKDLQDQTRQVLYDRPRKASIEYFEGKNIFTTDGKKITVTPAQARQVYQYLVKNNYIDEDDNVTQDYRDDVQTDSLRPLPRRCGPCRRVSINWFRPSSMIRCWRICSKTPTRRLHRRTRSTTASTKRHSRRCGGPSTTNMPIRWTSILTS